jgi:hypothetical protein
MNLNPVSSRFFRAVALALFGVLGATAPAQNSATQHARTAPVLDLDGNGSYVELPENLSTNAVITVEGWVKWKELTAWSKFLSFAGVAVPVDIGQFNNAPNLRLARFRRPDFDELTLTTAPDVLETNRWFHIAGVAGADFLKLYVNGVFVSSDTRPDPWRPIPPPPLKNYLGRDIMNDVANADSLPDLNGQIAEVRIWKRERSEAEIRETMFQRLTGDEPDLIGLWNFADGAANDATANAHHGKLMGEADIAEALLPTPNTLTPWSRLRVLLVDSTGEPLQQVRVRAEVDGVTLDEGFTDLQGIQWFTLWTDAKTVDLEATSPDGLGGWQFSVPLEQYTLRTHDWTIGKSSDIGGKARALDGVTPHAGLVVELVTPEDSSTDRRAVSVSPPPIRTTPRPKDPL